MTEEEIIKQAGKEAEEYIESRNEDKYRTPTFFWSLKKQILKDKYNIDWLTPEEEYPDITFN